MALLWGTRYEEQARQSLRNALSTLRKKIGPDVLISKGETVALNTTTVSCDVNLFESLAIEESMDALREAAALYQGEFLSDLRVDEEEFDAWARDQRQRLQAKAVDTLVRLAEEELSRDRASDALEVARRALTLDSFREDAHRCAMRALAALGRRAEALQHYRDYENRLETELHALPDEEIQRLRESIEKGRATTQNAPVNGDLVSTDRLRDQPNERNPDGQVSSEATVPPLPDRP